MSDEVVRTYLEKRIRKAQATHVLSPITVQELACEMRDEGVKHPGPGQIKRVLEKMIKERVNDAWRTLGFSQDLISDAFDSCPEERRYR